MKNWSFLTNHARAMLFLAKGRDSRLRDVAAALDITERTAHSIISDLTDAGYVAKEKLGRRNVYHVHADLPLRDSNGERAIGEFLSLFDDTEPDRE
jgi:predicted transcriptional regulator